MSYSVERLVDRHSICDALYRYCRGIDRREWDLVRGAFFSDAIDDHGVYVGDVEGLIEFARERHEFITMSMHLIGNILIEFTGKETALSESYCYAVQSYTADPKAADIRAAISGGKRIKTDSPIDMMMWVRYVDRMERRGGEWRIARRTTVWDRTLVQEASTDGPTFGATWPVGKRGQDDPLLTERSSVGLGGFPAGKWTTSPLSG
jgi:SnoaL-like domain